MSPHTPLRARLRHRAEGRPAALYVDGRKLGNEVRHALEELADVREPWRIRARSRRARQGAARGCGSIRPPARKRIARLIADNGGKVLRGADPIAPMKAIKNDAEIAGARAAQLRDGAAVTRFLAWFDREAPRRTS